jgi:hypothetical protein
VSIAPASEMCREGNHIAVSVLSSPARHISLQETLFAAGPSEATCVTKSGTGFRTGTVS